MWEKHSYSPRRNSPGGGVLGLIFAEYVPLASQSPYPIIVYLVANYRPHLSLFWQIGNFRDPNLATFYFYEFTHFLSWMKNTLLFIYSTNISSTFANRKYEELSYPQKYGNVRPHSSNSIENVTPL